MRLEFFTTVDGTRAYVNPAHVVGLLEQIQPDGTAVTRIVLPHGLDIVVPDRMIDVRYQLDRGNG